MGPKNDKEESKKEKEEGKLRKNMFSCARLKNDNMMVK